MLCGGVMKEFVWVCVCTIKHTPNPCIGAMLNAVGACVQKAVSSCFVVHIANESRDYRTSNS